MSALIEVLNNIYKQKDIGFILKRSVVESTVFSDEQSRYALSFVSEDYVYDKEVFLSISESESGPKLYQDNAFISKLKEKTDQLLTQDQSFSFHLKHNGNYYLVQYLAVPNINDEIVAYIFSIGIDSQYQVIHSTFFVQILSVLITYTLLFIIIIISKTHQRRIYEFAMFDPLTKVYNRRSFYEFANKEIARSHRSNKPLHFALLDIDHFKKVNDTYGHSEGDHVLKTLVSILNDSIRSTDILGRYGGEEFVLMFPETDINNALMIAERIRHNVADYNFSTICHVTISLGIAQKRPGEHLEEVLKRADSALYTAKNNGRNQVSSS